jgi:AcrR family transcriptional regulator
MAEENPIRDQILVRARQEFFVHGFSKVTTDELATALGISKKTLYQQFSSKEELLREVVYRMRDDSACSIDLIVDDPELDFIEKLRTVMTMIGSKISAMQQPFFQDMQRKAPDLWRELEAFRREKIFTVIGRLIKQGSSHGMLRRDIDPQLFTMMFFALVQNMINPETLSHLPFTVAQVFETFIRVMFEGVLTDEARVRYFGDEPSGNSRSQRKSSSQRKPKKPR